MKKTHIIFTIIILVAALALSSCGYLDFSKKIEKIEIGMTKKDVIKILGNDYTLVQVRPTPEGLLETFRYHTTIDDYILNFLDDKLQEWYVPQPEKLQLHHQNAPHPPHHNNK